MQYAQPAQNAQPAQHAHSHVTVQSAGPVNIVVVSAGAPVGAHVPPGSSVVVIPASLAWAAYREERAPVPAPVPAPRRTRAPSPGPWDACDLRVRVDYSPERALRDLGLGARADYSPERAPRDLGLGARFEQMAGRHARFGTAPPSVRHEARAARFARGGPASPRGRARGSGAWSKGRGRGARVDPDAERAWLDAELDEYAAARDATLAARAAEHHEAERGRARGSGAWSKGRGRGARVDPDAERAWLDAELDEYVAARDATLAARAAEHHEAERAQSRAELGAEPSETEKEAIDALLASL